ncbi:MAG: DUF1801 domain-containing protein [Ignavibacteria bacterium]|nr:DUF1801 domain-containing protein [Ignavibacteria bacterium]
MLQKLDKFYFEKDEPIRTCLLKLRSIIVEQETNITETKKYGMPCFCYKKNILCYLWTDKKTDEPYILFAEGKYLDHPALEAGGRTRMKIFRVNPDKVLPLKTIENILQSALDLYRTGIVKLRK